MKIFLMEIGRKLLMVGAVELSDSLIVEKLRLETPVTFLGRIVAQDRPWHYGPFQFYCFKAPVQPGILIRSSGR